MQSSDGRAVVWEARRWIDTPYSHQGRLRGHRVDCAGVVVGVGLDLDIFRVGRDDWADAFRRWIGYGRKPNPPRMKAALDHFLVPIADDAARAGDVMWLRWHRGPPMHLAIAGSRPGPGCTMIHAHARVGRCVEHDMGVEWPPRVVAWYRYPGLF